MEKIRIKKKVECFQEEIFENSFESVINDLKEMYDELTKEGWTELTFERVYIYEYSEIELHGMNYETDQEFNKRIKKIEMDKEKEKDEQEKEKLEYERLKKKFENNL